MQRLSWPHQWKIKLLLILLLCLSLIGFATNYSSSSTILITTSISSANVFSSPSFAPSLHHHPFENHCKFPLINAYANDLSSWKISERMRQLKCPTDFPLATQDSEGAMYVHPHYAMYPNSTDSNMCRIEIFEGGLRDKQTNRGKDDIKNVAVFKAPVNKRFIVNADAFRIKCEDKNKTFLWEKTFAGMYDENHPKNKVILIPDTLNFDNYGRQLKRKPKEKKENRLSIDILGFDSTSRTLFQRHMPRTWETMHRLGFEVLFGYNKVGDNSMVNLEPILVGDIKEAMETPKLDSSGDINPQWILPTNRSLDPTDLPFLWKIMKEKFGCKSMLNEDISMKALGLFHYPSKEFLPGFTESPADHFYRAFYLSVYENWKYGPCKNGDQIQKEFVDLWHRFATKYKDICHFGFSFITTLTHETGILLETIDEHVTMRLENMETTGALEDSLSIILGDHGNRIGLVQYSYSGRIEERMPLMAIRIPERIRREHPEAYAEFQKNKYKLTSNFDVHQMLVDVAEMKFGEERPEDGSRGISLFRKIPETRTCFDAYISENFCSCMIDRSELKEPLGQPAKSVVHRKSKVLLSIRSWLSENKLDNCLNSSSLPVDLELKIMGINPLARHGLRSKENSTKVENARKAAPKMDFLFHETVIPIDFTGLDGKVDLLFRVEDNIVLDEFSVVFEPSVQNPPSHCPYKSIFDVCYCLLF